MNRPKFYVYLPIVFALILILGIIIGRTLNTPSQFGVISVDGTNKYNKVEEILRYIHNQYVDTINDDKLIEQTINALLQNLDPHSIYITAEELKSSNEPLQGNFEGIGIEFNIVNDTIRIISAIPGGPAEKVGMQAGDKIVEVEGKLVAGIKISNKDVITNLKGKEGTKVKVGVIRKEKTKPLNFTITRGTIPIYSIDAANMLNDKTGYIKISRFAFSTYDEYKKAFEKLQLQGMQQLLLDLRGNGGGYLNTAVSIADEFLSDGKEIVYTIGKARPRTDYKATSKGSFENGKLVVLIDDGSASASEIVAGALQDNDRATIVGRRSFGKGLVQEQTEFSDGSGMRLTIARYYTPTGRSIQKTYTNGVKGKEAYYNEEYQRYENGEMENADSIKVNDSLIYKTPAGKIVYGGGGIVPDVFVPLDTSGRSPYLTEVLYNGIIHDFAFAYADSERNELKKFSSADHYNRSFEISPKIITDFMEYANTKGVKPNQKQFNYSQSIIKFQLKALIARNIWGNEGFYAVIEKEDLMIKKALELLK